VSWKFERQKLGKFGQLVSRTHIGTPSFCPLCLSVSVSLFLTFGFEFICFPEDIPWPEGDEKLPAMCEDLIDRLLAMDCDQRLTATGKVTLFTFIILFFPFLFLLVRLI
jgi:hypothetical protein